MCIYTHTYIYTYIYILQVRERKTHRKIKIPSSRWSHISGLSMDSDHWHMWLWKKASLSLRASVLILPHFTLYAWVSQVALVVKNLPANTGYIPDPWVRKIPCRRKWQSTPGFLMESPMDRGAWRATVHRVTKGRTQLKWLSTRAPCTQWGAHTPIWGWWDKYTKFMLHSSHSTIQIRDCISAYWDKRNFTWLSGTWVCLLNKAWIKIWQAPTYGNQNMDSTPSPVISSQTNDKVVHSFVQEQTGQGLWIIPEEGLFKMWQTYKMSQLTKTGIISYIIHSVSEPHTYKQTTCVQLEENVVFFQQGSQ